MENLFPQIIQGGMGVRVSTWLLARVVSMLGQLGVVSGTALDTVLIRMLQLGDPGGHMRRAMKAFPYQGIVERVLEEYYIPGGKKPGESFVSTLMFTINPRRSLVELTVLANFIEVYLAKEGHNGVVGINYLEKIQMPTLASIYGAMLAGVDYILMGAGIPKLIPGILDSLSQGLPVKMKIEVDGALPTDDFFIEFDPKFICGENVPVLKRPKFLAIISSATLAIVLSKKSTGKVDGFIVEGSSAGGHNAPPRRQMQLSEKGEPIYGKDDLPDLEKIKALGLPFWLAGSYGRKGGLYDAISLGATGIQVGTMFAFCDESGIAPEIKDAVRESCKFGKAKVFTDPVASPTGFPFKVVQLDSLETLADSDVYKDRCRMCDLGYLRKPYRKADGTLGYKCPSEDINIYGFKGGKPEDVAGRKCVCNGLMATIGLGSIGEPALITSGDDLLSIIAQFGFEPYTARQVIELLLELV